MGPLRGRRRGRAVIRTDQLYWSALTLSLFAFPFCARQFVGEQIGGIRSRAALQGIIEQDAGRAAETQKGRRAGVASERRPFRPRRSCDIGPLVCKLRL